MNIYENLPLMKHYALQHSKRHGVNYNIIIANPDKDGKFNQAAGSTYECVTDSYFEKPRPHVRFLFCTAQLLDQPVKTEMGYSGEVTLVNPLEYKSGKGILIVNEFTGELENIHPRQIIYKPE